MTPQFVHLLEQSLNHLQNGNFQAAELLLKQVIEIDPFQVDANRFLGIIYAQSGYPEQALTFFGRALNAAPNDGIILSNIGNVLHALKRYSEALSHHEKAITLLPTYPEAYNNKGNTLYDLGRYEEALFFYEKAISLAPNYAQAYGNRGNTLLKLKRHVEALTSHDTSLTISPNEPQAWMNKANSLFEIKRFSEAITNYSKAIELNPNYAEAWSGRANTYSQMERYQDAVSDYDRAIQLNPNYAEAFLNKGGVLFTLDRSREAIDCFDAAIRIDPNYVLAWSNMGGILNQLGQYDESIKCYERGISIDPKNPVIHKNKGELLHKLRKYEEALSCFDTALVLSPTDADLHYKIGLTNRALRRYSDAIHNFENAINLNYTPREDAEFVLSALKSENFSTQMPKSYTASLFNQFAENFDEHLLNALKYQSPRITLSILKPYLQNGLKILDLGCGTGLMGGALKPYAEKIIGVDISKNMLRKAEETGAYSELVEDDIHDFTAKCREKFNLIVSTDVFIYIGDLATIFKNIEPLMEKSGLLSFTVEKGLNKDFFLSPETLRYSHNKQYIEQLIASHSFSILNIVDSPIRENNGVHVDGHYFLLQKN